MEGSGINYFLKYWVLVSVYLGHIPDELSKNDVYLLKILLASEKLPYCWPLLLKTCIFYSRGLVYFQPIRQNVHSKIENSLFLQCGQCDKCSQIKSLLMCVLVVVGLPDFVLFQTVFFVTCCSSVHLSSVSFLPFQLPDWFKTCLLNPISYLSFFLQFTDNFSFCFKHSLDEIRIDINILIVFLLSLMSGWQGDLVLTFFPLKCNVWTKSQRRGGFLVPSQLFQGKIHKSLMRSAYGCQECYTESFESTNQIQWTRHLYLSCPAETKPKKTNHLEFFWSSFYSLTKCKTHRSSDQKSKVHFFLFQISLVFKSKRPPEHESHWLTVLMETSCELAAVQGRLWL